MGEWAKISARRGDRYWQRYSAPDLSRAVGTPPTWLATHDRNVLRGHAAARMAQIRRG